MLYTLAFLSGRYFFRWLLVSDSYLVRFILSFSTQLSVISNSSSSCMLQQWWLYTRSYVVYPRRGYAAGEAGDAYLYTYNGNILIYLVYTQLLQYIMRALVFGTMLGDVQGPDDLHHHAFTLSFGLID